MRAWTELTRRNYPFSVLTLIFSLLSSTPCRAQSIEWYRQFGSTSNEFALGVAADSTGVYVVGFTDGTFPGQRSLGARDAFIRKFDLSGRELWTQQFGTSASDEATSVNSDGNSIYVTGSTDGQFPGEAAFGGTDGFLRKYDVSG